MRYSLGIIVICLMAMVAVPATAQKPFAIENGEHWWGALVANGSVMPYNCDSTAIYDLEKVNFNNQAAPLLISSHGRYIWSEKPFTFRFLNDTIFISGTGEKDAEIFNAGHTLRDAYLAASKAHFPFTGTIPEEIFFSAPQYNTWIELAYDQNQHDIMAYADSALANGFPPGIFMIDDNWQRYYGNFDFKAERFPDARAMCDTLHAKGFKIMTWICPFVSPDSPEFRYMWNKYYMVRDSNTNSVCIVPWWNGRSAAIDITKPSAREYLASVLREAQDKYGIDGFKFDAGDVQYMTMAPCKYHNDTLTANDYSEAWASFAEQFPYNELRAGWKNGGRPIVQRLGDKDYSWNALRTLITDITAAGLLGYAYTCPDMIGGGMLHTFSEAMKEGGKFDEELLVRSCQIHSMMPMMQFSVAPWRVLSKKNSDICARFANFHAEMAPYILACAHHAAQTGEPIVRHMEYSFPNQGFENCDSQYMLGDKYFVAPMITPGYTRSVKLPKGRWRDDLGKIHKGGTTIEISVPIERLPIFELIK